MVNQLLSPEDVIDKYTIVEEIGSGGAAIVYRAVDNKVQRDVAIKVLRPHLSSSQNMVKRFAREVDVLMQIEHPHILPLYDNGEDDGLFFFVMRYITEGTLEDRIRDRELSLTQISRYLNQICSALTYAHNNQIVHRDLEPTNLLIDRGNNIYISDFGIARLMQAADMITRTNDFVGTPAYMAPEQYTSTDINAYADYFALGVITFEMLTGNLPLDSQTPQEYIYKFAREEELEIVGKIQPTYGETLGKIVERMVKRNPAERYPTLDDFLFEFNAEVDYLVSVGVGDDFDTNTQPARHLFESKYSKQLDTVRQSHTEPPEKADEQVTEPSLPKVPYQTLFDTNSGEEDGFTSNQDDELKHPPNPAATHHTSSQPAVSPFQIQSARAFSAPPNNASRQPPGLVIEAPRPTQRAAAPPQRSQRHTVKPEFKLKKDARPVPPMVCPVCLQPADERIEVPIKRLTGRDTLPIYFCAVHASAYNSVNPLVYVGHIGMVALIIGAFLLVDIFGLVMMIGLYALVFDWLNNLGSAAKTEARQAVKISVKNGQYHFKMKRNRYAKAYQEANRNQVDWD